MQCTWINTSGTCQSTARVNGLCLYHSEIAAWLRQGIFALSMIEVCERIERLTSKQQDMLARLCNGQTYESAAQDLGITENALTQRVTHAKARAGAKSRSELVALYAIWRSRKAGANMP